MEAADAAEADETVQWQPRTLEEIEAFAELAGVRFDEASSRVTSDGCGSAARVRCGATALNVCVANGPIDDRHSRVRLYSLAGRASSLAFRVEFAADEGALLSDAATRDVRVRDARALLDPLLAMLELDVLLARVEQRGAVAQLLQLLPRYERLASERRRVLGAARDVLGEHAVPLASAAGDNDDDDDDDDAALAETIVSFRPDEPHLFAFDVQWDIDFDEQQNRLRSTFSFRCLPSAPLADKPELLAVMEERFLQLVEHSGVEHACATMKEMALVD